ncbi:MAG: hypothetical protein K2P52_08480 [Campylobacterales bacterium]|nr:hypothetical protein [Campylobacterales bacterium]
MENSEKLYILMTEIEEGEKILYELELGLDALYSELTELRKHICGMEHCSADCDSDEHCHMHDHCDEECKKSRFCCVEVKKEITIENNKELIKEVEDSDEDSDNYITCKVKSKLNKTNIIH